MLSKIHHFSSAIILGDFYRHLAIFSGHTGLANAFWSHFDNQYFTVGTSVGESFHSDCSDRKLLEPKQIKWLRLNTLDSWSNLQQPSLEVPRSLWNCHTNVRPQNALRQRDPDLRLLWQPPLWPRRRVWWRCRRIRPNSEAQWVAEPEVGGRQRDCPRVQAAAPAERIEARLGDLTEAADR